MAKVTSEFRPSPKNPVFGSLNNGEVFMFPLGNLNNIYIKMDALPSYTNAVALWSGDTYTISPNREVVRIPDGKKVILENANGYEKTGC